MSGIEAGINDCPKKGWFDFLKRKPRPPTAAESVEAERLLGERRELREANEARQRRHSARVASPAHIELQAKLLEAGLPGEIAQVIGRTCSYWNVSEEVPVAYPYVSRIMGIRTDLDGTLQIRVDFGPGGVPRTFRHTGRRSWIFWEYGVGKVVMDNLQLL